MNTGLWVLVMGLAWSASAFVVALAFGAMARARDVVAVPPLQIGDEGVRTAV